MSAVRLVVHGWIFAVALMLVLWYVQKVKRDAGVVDLGWCAGIGIVVLYYAFFSGGWLPRRILVTALVCMWAFRLAAYILVDRVLRAPTEDGRYRHLRSRWGERADFYFFFFFESQTLLVSLFSIPVLVLLRNPRASFSPWEAAGVVLWIVSIAGESAADRRLARFRADPKSRGRTCREGLWRYSRHPNYFFEWLHWWSYVAMAVGAPHGWLTLLGPAVMLFFLLVVTGIPYTEAQALRSRGEDYREYQRTTSAFVPWFPREKRRGGQ
ncbi:MAG: DUF1295 domain-containing protein [Candidatus Binatia bacterium]